MKFILFSDIHFHKHNAFATYIDGVHSRVFYTFLVLEQILDYARDNQIKDIFFAGDMYHTKSYIDTSVIDPVYAFFLKYRDEFNFYFISGNHDFADKGKHSLLTPFKALGKLAEGPEVYTLGTTRVGMIPYRFNKLSLLQEVSEMNVDVLILHEGISGAKVEGREIEEGLNLKELKKTLSSRVKHVFMGHFHDPKCLDDSMVSFIGAPIHITFGDIGPRGFQVYDTDAHTHEMVETVFPKFITLDDAAIKKYSEEDLKELCTSNYVRFQITKETALVERIKEVTPVVINLQAEKRDYEQRLDIGVSDDLSDIMAKYIAKFNTNFDVDKLLTIGSEIIEESK